MRISNLLFLLAVILSALFVQFSVSAQIDDMTLFDAKTTPCIVAPASPTPAEAFAIKELRDYLQKITGKDIQVVSPDGRLSTPAIIAGVQPLNKNLAVEKLGPEEFVIDVSKDFVRIAGGSGKTVTNAKGEKYVQERGTLYGVYEFLETLGVRWYRPDPWGEYVPQLQTINLPTGVKTYRPAYMYRYGINGYRWWQDETMEQRAMGRLWATRNRQNCNIGTQKTECGGSYQVNFSHSYMYVIPAGRYFASHPEYFALINGKRIDKREVWPTQLCLSNPDIQRLFVEGIAAQAKDNPQIEVISVEPNDMQDWCECDGCKAMDDPKLKAAMGGGVSMANRVCAFNNIIALKLAEQALQVKIGWLAYNQHTEVPTLVTRLEPNTVVMAAAFAGGYSDYSKKLGDPSSEQNTRFLDTLRGYGKLTQVMVHEYWGGYAWFGPLPVIHTMVDRLREYRHLGVVGVYNQVDQNWGPQGLVLYMYCKLLWNPDLDVDKELDLYYTNYYGPAAAPMKRYHEALEKAADGGPYFGSGGYLAHSIFSEKLLPILGADIDEATALVKGREPYEKRLDGVRAGYEVARRFQKAEKLMKDLRLAESDLEWRALEDYILGFKTGEVFNNGPSPKEALDYIRNYSKDNRTQVELLAHYENPKIIQNLNKDWRFLTDPKEEGLTKEWMRPEFNMEQWGSIDADRWWQEQGFRDFKGVAWYRKQFQPPVVASGKSINLYFGAVDGNAAVFLNGKKVGEHVLPENGDGWDKPFSFDITNALEQGKPNLIAVRVKDTVGMSGIFKGVQIIESAIPAEIVSEEIKPAAMSAEQGFCYMAALTLGRTADSNGKSECILLEDGKPLSAPHSWHKDIRATGMGKYSHWTDTALYFSTSDNSDPRKNGRKYTLSSLKKQ
jgi:hypothetical protein